MTLFLLLGVFCILAVIGFFITNHPFKFAIGGMVSLIALVFIFLIILVVWTMNDQCSAPFTDHNSSYCKNRTVSTSQGQKGVLMATDTNSGSSNDPFPFNNGLCDANGCPQYEWYDRHSVPMSNRCYPNMATSCTDIEWKQALSN